jgi:hypothetical protein
LYRRFRHATDWQLEKGTLSGSSKPIRLDFVLSSFIPTPEQSRQTDQGRQADQQKNQREAAGAILDQAREWLKPRDE